MSIGQVIVRNRVECCSDRIVGYSIALFSEADGVGMQSYPQLFANTQVRPTPTIPSLYTHSPTHPPTL
jgi:hypothetical protein